MNEYDASAETQLILEKINIKPVGWNNSGEPNMELWI